jgi:serine/threonine-protein kinase HipA
MVSALTVLGLDEMTGRYASYEDLAEKLRSFQINPKRDLTELFSRITFNILCGNTDDHARNHALFWDGNAAAMTPAYDICPQRRTGQTASQAMLIHGEDKSSRLTTCLEAAPTFLLTEAEAKDIIERQVEVIRAEFSTVCDEARLGSVDRSNLMGRQFLNPFAFEDWPALTPDLPAPE